MSIKHTPGPWNAEKPDMFGDCNILHEGDSLAIGAIVSNMRSADEVYANALLAAAAPEMKEILERILNSYPGYIPDFCEAIAILIRKVEDRQS